MSSRSSSSSTRSSSSSCSARRVHLWCAWITALPLLLSVSSGMAYRICRTLGAEKLQVRWLLRVHTLEVLGLRSYYPLLLFTMVLSLLLTGFTMTAIWNWFCRNCCCGCGPRRRDSASANRSLEHAVEQYERAAAAAATSAGGAQKGLLAGSHGVSISDAGGSDLPASAAAAGDESEWSGSESDARGRSGSGGGLADDDDFLRRRVASHLTSRWTLQQRLHSWLPPRFTARWMHRTLGTAVLLPFGLTAFTGAAWIWASDWLYWEKPQYALLMYLHEGRYIEASGTVYVGVIGSATVGLIVAGSVMLLTRARAAQRSGSSSGAAATRRYITAPIVHVPSASSSSHSSASASLHHLASEPEVNSDSAFLSPSSLETRRTMARIHKAFDIDPASATGGEETEDELGMHSPPTGK